MCPLVSTAFQEDWRWAGKSIHVSQLSQEAKGVKDVRTQPASAAWYVSPNLSSEKRVPANTGARKRNENRDLHPRTVTTRVMLLASERQRPGPWLRIRWHTECPRHREGSGHSKGCQGKEAWQLDVVGSRTRAAARSKGPSRGKICVGTGGEWQRVTDVYPQEFCSPVLFLASVTRGAVGHKEGCESFLTGVTGDR